MRTKAFRTGSPDHFPALLVAAGILAVSRLLHAQDPAAADQVAAAPAAEPGTDEPIDEITVIGEKTITAIKAQIVSADRRMYGLFNEMNMDREYDIHCRLERIYNSNRKERICQPAFEQGILEESWYDLSTYTDAGRPEAELRHKREILRQKMTEYAEKNPALKKAIFERAQLQRKLRDARSGKRGAAQDE